MRLLYPATLDPKRDWDEYDIIKTHLSWAKAMHQTAWHSSDRESDTFLGAYLEGQGLPVNAETLATLRARMGLRAPAAVPLSGDGIERVAPTDYMMGGIDFQYSYSPVILHVPHAGLGWPDDGTAMPDCADLTAEMTLMADLFTDKIAKKVVQSVAGRAVNRADFVDGELVTTPAVYPETRWPSLFMNRLTRVAMDPERFDDDTEEMNQVGMGVVYERTHDGQPLYTSGLTPQDAARRKALWYAAYGEAFARLVGRVLEREGRCLIIDLHSYSVDPLPYERHQQAARPEVCLGYEPYHDPGIDAIERVFAAHGFGTAQNEPFAGSYVPLGYWRQDPRVKSVMVEVRKDQYLDGTTLKLDGVERLAAAIVGLIDWWYGYDSGLAAELRTEINAGGLVEAASRLAHLAHDGQVDKAGRDYVGHPGRVAEHVAAAGGPPEAVAAGWLHDTVEDTWVSLEFLAQAGFPDVVIQAVDAVTKRAGEPTEDYARRIATNPVGVIVKRADLADNTDPGRLSQLEPSTRARLEAKYAAFTDQLDTAFHSK